MTGDALRTEFPHCDLHYVRRVCPQALGKARVYNKARNAIDPANQNTIKAARRAKSKLTELVG